LKSGGFENLEILGRYLKKNGRKGGLPLVAMAALLDKEPR
jgi:hypothetical protein